MRYKLLLTLVINLFIFQLGAQTNEVSLIVSSKGTTEDEARTNALRSAIEQAFGTFVSSRTDILNDNLVQDQIVSLSNGNIKKFEILSSLFLPEQNAHLVTLNATVSLDKLTSFVQSKGYNDVSFDGGGFAMNLKIQKLNESSEIIALRYLLEQGLILSENFFDRNLIVGNPVLEDANSISSKYQVQLTVNSNLNRNWTNFREYYIKTLRNIAMTDAEVESYKALKKNVYELVLLSRTYELVEWMDYRTGEKVKTKKPRYDSSPVLCFRTKDALAYFTSYCILLNSKYLDRVKIAHELDTVNLDIDYNSKYRIKFIYSNNFANMGHNPSNLWIIGEFPFDQSNNAQTIRNYSYQNGQGQLGDEIVVGFYQYANENLLRSVTEYFDFTKERGRRIEQYEAEDKFRKPVTLALNSSDNSYALTSISDHILANNMLSYYFTKNRIYELIPYESQYQIQINLSFTELEIEQIRGFKLIK